MCVVERKKEGCQRSDPISEDDANNMDPLNATSCCIQSDQMVGTFAC